MGWIAIVLAVFVAYCAHPYFLYNVAILRGRARNLVLQYFVTVLLAWVAVFASNLIFRTNFEWRTQMLVVAVIGVANAFACFVHWKATAISQAVTSISTWLDDIIPLALGLVILNEFQLLNAAIVGGILLAVGSAVLFATQKGSLGGIDSGKVIQIYKYILMYSVIWGVAGFAMRYLSVKENMQILGFISSWYSGSFVGALLVYYFAHPLAKRKPLSNKKSLVLKKVGMLAGSAILSLTAQYWAKSLVPLVFTQPIFMTAEMVFPTLIGLYIFNEHKHFTRLGWLLMLSGLIGGLVIATNL